MGRNTTEITRFRRGYWTENWRRTMRDWEDRQSLVSVALLVLALLGYGAIADDPKMAQVGVAVAGAYLALRFFVMTPAAMWKDAQGTIIEFDERAKPRLGIVFEPDTPPYLQELFIQPRGAPRPFYDRRYRVGIRNDSNEVISNVRVVLESFDANYKDESAPLKPNQPVLIEHALNVMGRDDKHGLVDVVPGDRPTAFVDVVAQAVDNDEGDWLSPCYASGHSSGLFSRADYLMGLRVEGGGTFSRARFLVRATLENRRIVMTPYSLP